MTSLFDRRSGWIRLHSGGWVGWKIDCDALTDEDLETLADLFIERVRPFRCVFGVPRGGSRIANALAHATTPDGGVLVVDDVWTSGASLLGAMAEFKDPPQGAVVFARTPVPEGVVALFTLTPVPEPAP